MKYLILCFMFTSVAFSQSGKRKEKVIYKYKKYEKFNLEDISVDGESGNPGDLSIFNRYQRKFKNKLPYRKNFRPEVIFSHERMK